MILSVLWAGAQDTSGLLKPDTVRRGRMLIISDTLHHAYHLFSYDPNDRLDLVDVGRSFLKGRDTKRVDTVKQKVGKLHISALPVAGYTLQTGFAGVLSSNFAIRSVVFIK